MKVQSTHEVVMERTKRAMALRAQGKSIAEVADEMGVKTGALHYYLYHISKKNSAEVVNRIKQHGKKRIVSVLGSTVNGHGDVDKVTHLLAEVLRMLPDDKLVEMIKGGSSE